MVAKTLAGTGTKLFQQVLLRSDRYFAGTGVLLNLIAERINRCGACQREQAVTGCLTAVVQFGSVDVIPAI